MSMKTQSFQPSVDCESYFSPSLQLSKRVEMLQGDLGSPGSRRKKKVTRTRDQSLVSVLSLYTLCRLEAWELVVW